MEKTILLLVVVMLSPSWARAWTFDKNPDKVLSVGFNYQHKDLAGNYQATTQGTRWDISNGSAWKTDDFIFDLRLPMNNWLTIFAGGGLSQMTINSRDNTIAVISGFIYDLNVSTMQKLDGYNVNAGFRFYFH